MFFNDNNIYDWPPMIVSNNDWPSQSRDVIIIKKQNNECFLYENGKQYLSFTDFGDAIYNP